MATCCEAFCKHGNVFLSMQNLAQLAEQRPQGKEKRCRYGGTHCCTRYGHSCNGMIIKNSYVIHRKVTLPVTLNDVWRSLQLKKPTEYHYVGYLLCTDLIREGTLSVDGCRLSVCLSVLWLDLSRELKGPGSPYLAQRKPMTWLTREPVLMSKGQRSRSPGRLQLTH